MNPELSKAIAERLALGHTKEMIRAELLQAGYEESVIDSIISGNPSAVSGVTTEGELVPSATVLFWTGWQFAKRYYLLAIFLAIPMLLIEVARYITLISPTYAETSTVVVTIGNIIALVAYLLILTAALRLAVIDDGTTTHPFSSVKEWTTQHVVGLLWILFLSTLVVAGGFFLFIVPGIIVSFMLYLAQSVYAVEGKRGLEALLRSRELIVGHWGLLVGRLAHLVLFFFIALLGVGLVVGLLAAIIGGDPLSDLTWEFIFNLLGQLVSVAATIMGVKIGMVLYQGFAAQRPASTTTVTTGKGKYLTLAWLGFAGVLMIVIASVTYLEYPLLEEAAEEITDVNAKQRALELRMGNEGTLGEDTVSGQ